MLLQLPPLPPLLPAAVAVADDVDGKRLKQMLLTVAVAIVQKTVRFLHWLLLCR